MKRVAYFTGFALVALATDARAEVPIKILHCEGFNLSLNGTIEHDVEIYRDHAKFDERFYILGESVIAYTLYGPVEKSTAGAIFSAPQRIFINRVTGEYTISNPTMTDSSEWTRERDSGCVETRRKF